jgi:hypothetical protein
MVKVKINNKTYNVPELQFGDYTHMESQGISITEAFSRGQMTLIAMAFTCVVLKCDRAEAERVVTQHILGGGSMFDITDAFAEAVKQSDFFKKMLGLETEEPKKNQKKKTDEKQEVTAEE